MFNVDAFTQTSVTESFSTATDPVPVGEYTGMLEKIDKPRVQGEYIVWDLTWTVDDAALAAQLGRKKVTVRQSVFLDVTEAGNLDTSKGKNVQLGRLREALGQNAPGQAWAPSMMQGKAAKIKVTHRTDADGNVRDQVSAVAALS
jgi:hypothetical protein